ncbi:hypothetical protein [Mangrovibrevibacter kandeliae]|uniref:hypothetical protein n=1 Tax=Mangrovibrevibacter kandeliae TaxID=2968473 RepID=UPI0021177125|nr:hypothetical protein [Aurantimonas sp. CSK15Z-1]MCQ8783800.1 hypothetical protein [Aurantimonas sp. CSK15Z-1]
MRFVHLHATSGVGTTGFPVYSARIRTRFRAFEIASTSQSAGKAVDHAPDYVRFMSRLVVVAAARNPNIRLRRGGDPLLEQVIPMTLALITAPFLVLPIILLKLPLALSVILKKKLSGKLLNSLMIGAYTVILNLLPWSSGRRFDAADLPVDELPLRYREVQTPETNAEP